MKLAVSGVSRLHRKWPEMGEYARKMAAELLKDYPRIKKVRLTYTLHEPDWSIGFSWLVRGDQVEIAIPPRFMYPARIKWLILHELMHARQILEKRLNKNLDNVSFTNRLGNTYTFTYRMGEGRYGEYWCRETGKCVRDREPWEKEANGDVDRLQRRNGVPRS